MARTCTICTHTEREAIDAALVTGEPLRTIADRHKVSKTTLLRHRQKHLAEQLRQADAEGQLSAQRLLHDLAGLQARAVRLLERAEKAGDLRAALAGVREARGCIEAAARLLETTDLERRIEALEQAREGAV